MRGSALLSGVLAPSPPNPISFSRMEAFMTCLSLAFLALLAAGPDKAPSKPDAIAAMSFEEKAKEISGTIACHMMNDRIAVGPKELSLFEGCRDFADFHGELPAALRADDSGTRKAALRYLWAYAAVVRGSAWELDRDDGNEAIRLGLGRHITPIRIALERVSKKAKGEEALLSAIVLLTLSPDDQKAIDVLLLEMNSKESVRRRKACQFVGFVRLSQPRVVAALGAALGAKERKVQLAAADAIWTSGPRARKAVPELIALLESGDGWGKVTPFMTIALPERVNLPLLALGEMGDDARPAVPVIVRLLKGADEETQLALLGCLGKLGASAKESAGDVRRYLGKETPRVRLRAAVALLCMNPGEEKAIEVVSAALKGDDLEKRGMALEDLARLGPKVKALVPHLVALLDKNENRHFREAAWAISRMGPTAAAAVPALARHLSAENNDHIVPAYAAQALAAIGKPALPALLEALRVGKPRPPIEGEKEDANRSALERGLDEPGFMGRLEAAKALSEFRDDKAKVVPVLLKALNDDVIRGSAAYALGRLKPDDPKVKAALIRVRDQKDEIPKGARRGEAEEEFYAESRIMAAWALRQLPK